VYVSSTTQRRTIKVLPTLVANQIAAGEVVERPASVVKELLENALDSGATRIMVDLEQGGTELVRVTDDGAGIARDELPLAIAPHATSKIDNVDDLDRIGTLGFRGEALASIAAVSRVTIRSRTREEAGAFVIGVEGGTVTAVQPAAGAVGTSVTVRNLFYNTPARRKFLRTVGTEQERCVEVVRSAAMAHPDVGVSMTADGRTLFDYPPGQLPRDRALAILGKELAPQLLEVHADEFDDSRGVALWGLAGHPSIARGTNKHQSVFINGRPIRDRTIQHAITEAYRGLIEPSRYPTVVLMLEMSAQGVDVNVHPQKTEVRFRDGSLIHSVVLRALREALRRADLTPSINVQRAGAGYGAGGALPGSGVAQPLVPTQQAGEESLQRFVDSMRRPPEGVKADALREALGIAGAQGGQGVSGAQGEHGASGAIGAGGAPGTSGAQGAAGAYGAPGVPGAHGDQPLLDARPPSRVLQVHNSYLVTQDEQGVVIIDQHALHERVMFEYLLLRVTQGALEQQRLLAPAMVPTTKRQMECLAMITPLLAKLGIEAEAAGPEMVGVHAFPTFLFDRGVDPVEFVQEVLERAESGAMPRDAASGGEEAMREVLDMMACKAAVKAGDRMSELELGELVQLRERVERASNCPHGRPTSIRLTIRELERLFGRS
jgi:DNA mismatch repair protein MutL